MQDRLLVLISLSITGIGLVMLMILLLVLPLPPYTPETTLGEKITLTGELTAVEHRGSITSLSITYPATITGTVFDSLQDYEPPKGCIQVIGTVEEYEGTRQLTITRILPCKPPTNE